MGAAERVATTRRHPEGGKRSIPTGHRTAANPGSARYLRFLVPGIPTDSRVLKRQRLVRTALALAVFGIDLLIWGGDTHTLSGTELPFWLVLLIGIAGYCWLAITRSPLPGYVALMILAVGSLALPSVECMAGFMMALFLVARHSSKRIAWIALAGAVIPISITTYNGVSYYESVTPLFVTVNAGLWTSVVVAAWISGRALARNAHRLAVERRWAEDARDEATAVERLRISRDLHDSVAHSMTAIVLQVAGVRTVIKSESTAIDVDKVLADVQSTAEQSMRELHRLLGMLRSQSESGIDRTHTYAEISTLVSAARDSGLEVLFTTHGTQQPLDPSVSHAAYRVVQEGLANVMKHAGEGARVEMSHDWTAAQLTLTLRSIDGVETRPAISGGYGLLGLRERLSVSGGTLHSAPTRDGYLLQATLPVTGKSGTHETEAFTDE